MLRELHIQNVAILPEVQVSFESGLNILTGETGAGKSILVDSIGLLAGQRSSGVEVRSGQSTAIIEGILQIQLDSSLYKILVDAGVSVDGGEVFIRRTITSDGRSKAFVNNVAWTISGLSQLAHDWIDISGQHSQSSLMDESTHVDLLDAFGGLGQVRASYQELYSAIRTIDSNLQELREKKKKTTQEREYWMYCHNELVRANLQSAEYDDLQSLHQRHQHSEKLMSAVNAVERAVSGEPGLIFFVGRALSELRNIIKLDHALQPWLDELEEIRVRLQEFHHQAVTYLAQLDFDPTSIEKINERLAELENIARKYGSIQNAITERDKIKSLLMSLDQNEDQENKLLRERTEYSKQLTVLAKDLSNDRQKKAKEFSAVITKELRSLGMQSAELEVLFLPVQEGSGTIWVNDQCYCAEGQERVCLNFSPNPGEGFGSLTKIVSGGELSRVLLAIKSITSWREPLNKPTFLFDEVDTGIGGETAERVGIRLKKLSMRQQVLCVTHLAQIACYADTHFRVTKEIVEGRTMARVDRLDSKQRKQELARMIGGIQITDKTLNHAAELLRRGTQIPIEAELT